MCPFDAPSSEPRKLHVWDRWSGGYDTTSAVVQWRQADDPSGGRPAGSPDYMCPHRRHIPLPNPCIHLSKKIKRIGNKKRAFPNRRRRRRDLLLLFVGPGDLSSAYGTRARRPPGTQSGKRAAASPSRLTPGAWWSTEHLMRLLCMMHRGSI